MDENTHLLLGKYKDEMVRLQQAILKEIEEIALTLNRSLPPSLNLLNFTR
jgi:hypothetical protein